MGHRVASSLVGPACVLGLLLTCYRAVLFQGGQFGYRDAGQFYYPLYLRVQQEWDAGRWPLWDPGQNAGAPLLGNPVAAVLYPGKVLYALLPYAWGARAYVLAHTVLAFLGMQALGRSLGVSREGSRLGGLAYAFGAPVLFQHCNVIFLVGAAWLPWGLRALDRLLRQGRRVALAELAVVLAMQVLGGDPQAAYLTGVAGVGYAVALAVSAGGGHARLLTGPRLLGVAGLWAAGTLGLAYLHLDPPGPAMARALALVAWAAAVVAIVRRGLSRRRKDPLVRGIVGLAGAAALATALSAAQLLPVLEFVGRCSRVTTAVPSETLEAFSVEPYRVAELVWPNVFGRFGPGNRWWLQAIPPAGDRAVWVPSLYLGALTLALALGAAGVRGAPPWRAWLTVVALVGLAASFGKFGGPLWWARWTPLAGAVGPHDPERGGERGDDFPGDGAGSPYRVLATLLPGFGLFRYSGKLLVLTAAATAALAGAGWDLLASGRAGRVRGLLRAGLAASLVGLAASWAVRARAIAYLARRAPPEPIFGPPDVAAAWAETQRALGYGVVHFAALLALARWAPRRPRAAGAVALLLLAIDLALANSGLVWAVPQAEFDAPPALARLIEADRQAHPAAGPFRVHWMKRWAPDHFFTHRSPRQLDEWVARERAMLVPLYSLPLGVEACLAAGSLDLDDFARFFGPAVLPAPDAAARPLGLPPGTRLTYYPRRAFDLWGARYFVLPAQLQPGWSPERGFASFLHETDLVYPDPALLRGAEGWVERQDWQLRRNRAAYPRAWLVHHGRVRRPVAGEAELDGMMRSLLYMNDPLWVDPGRPVVDLRASAWVETDAPKALQPYLSPTPVDPDESVQVVQHEPQRVELKARLNRPGLVVLADMYYPGWRLAIDGRPAPIFRANRLMRGAAVPAGEHTLVYTFAPESFRIGACVSAAGLLALAALLASSRRATTARTL